MPGTDDVVNDDISGAIESKATMCRLPTACQSSRLRGRDAVIDAQTSSTTGRHASMESQRVTVVSSGKLVPEFRATIP